MLTQIHDGAALAPLIFHARDANSAWIPIPWASSSTVASSPWPCGRLIPAAPSAPQFSATPVARTATENPSADGRGSTLSAGCLATSLSTTAAGVAMVARQRKQRQMACRHASRRPGVAMYATPLSGGAGAAGVPMANIFDAARAAGGGIGIGGGPMGGMPFGAQQQRTPEQDQTRQRVLDSIRNFRMKPRDVKAYLDRYVVEQDAAKKVLSVALCDHYNWARQCVTDPSKKSVNYAKPNILILGPTGSGKTYLIRTLAKMLGVPFVKADATKFSETGIVGEDAEDVVRGLVDAAGGDAELAQYGMVYIDEVDKIAGGQGGRGGSWSGKQVQSNFLKIMEDAEISTRSSMQASIQGMLGGGQDGSATISTKFVLFIFSGAFNPLNDLIKSRVGQQSIGFVIGEEEDDASATANKAGAESSNSRPKDMQSYLHLAETSDFVEAGLEPEFVGRVPVRVAIEALNADDLYRILTEAEDSVLQQYTTEFEGYGINLKSDPAGLRRVAELAVEEKTGARALVTILERKLRDFKFELPSTTCKDLVLTRELIDDPKGTLNELLCAPAQISGDLQRWIEQESRRSKVRIEMDDKVRERILEDCKDSKQPAEQLLGKCFKETGVLDGIAKIREATGGNMDLFTITMAIYEDPKGQIEKFLGETEKITVGA